MIQDRHSLHCAIQLGGIIEIYRYICSASVHILEYSFFYQISVVYLPFWSFISDFDAYFQIMAEFTMLSQSSIFS